LSFSQEHEHALMGRRTITAAEAIDALLRGGPDGTPVTALVVTARSRVTDTPLRVIAAFDLPELTASLSIT
jgi:hypothetical protein